MIEIFACYISPVIGEHLSTDITVEKLNKNIREHSGN